MRPGLQRQAADGRCGQSLQTAYAGQGRRRPGNLDAFVPKIYLFFQIIDSEKAQREKVLRDSVTWPQFLKQMREELAEETSASAKPKPNEEEDEGEDDALQEAILASMAEQKGLKQRGTRVNARRSLFDYDPGEEAERMNGKEYQTLANSTPSCTPGTQVGFFSWKFHPEILASRVCNFRGIMPGNLIWVMALGN